MKQRRAGIAVAFFAVKHRKEFHGRQHVSSPLVKVKFKVEVRPSQTMLTIGFFDMGIMYFEKVRQKLYRPTLNDILAIFQGEREEVSVPFSCPVQASQSMLIPQISKENKTSSVYTNKTMQ